MLLIGRTPAAISRSASHAGDGPIRTSTAASAYRPQAGSSMKTGGLGGVGWGVEGAVSSTPTPEPPILLLNATAASRARPYTLRQSGRLAVISKSITSPSIDATSNPHDAR